MIIKILVVHYKVFRAEYQKITRKNISKKFKNQTKLTFSRNVIKHLAQLLV